MSVGTSHNSTRKTLGTFSLNLKIHSSTGDHDTLVHLAFILP